MALAHGRRRRGDEVMAFLLKGPGGRLIRSLVSLISLNTYRVYGDPSRLNLADGVSPMNTLFNTVSGSIEVGPHTIFGHNVSILTGSHEYRLLGPERAAGVPTSGRDIVIEEGAWIASNATVLGPCRIGAHAVVAAGSLAHEDVPRHAIVAGVPAKVVGYVTDERPA